MLRDKSVPNFNGIALKYFIEGFFFVHLEYWSVVFVMLYLYLGLVL